MRELTLRPFSHSFLATVGRVAREEALRVTLSSPQRQALGGREHFAKVIEAFRRVAADHTIISGFISPIEREVFRALSEIEGAQLVKVLPCAMYHDYQPGVEWLPAIKERRLAIIACGNSPSEFDRRACLDLNAAIIPIAKKNGRALWWRSDGRFSWL